MKNPIVQLWLALAFMACAAVVAGAFEAGPKLWDQTTAAWVQALGALGAMAVVFLIDNRAAARLRKDRADEALQRRRERQEAISRSEHARLSAIFYGSQAFARAAGVMRMQGAALNETAALPPAMRQRIRGAEGAINALLAQPGEVVPEVVVALSLASQTIGHWRARAEGEQPVVGPGNLASYLNVLKEAQHALMEIYNDAHVDLRAARQYADED
jgi:hypothetical protein